MDKKEYNELLIKYYSENNSFIEKAIFTVSAGALTFLIGLNKELHFNGCYILTLVGFITTMILQLISARISKEGCDKGLDEKCPEKGNKWFKCSEIINDVFFISFILSIIMATITVLTSNKI